MSELSDVLEAWLDPAADPPFAALSPSLARPLRFIRANLLDASPAERRLVAEELARQATEVRA